VFLVAGLSVKGAKKHSLLSDTETLHSVWGINLQPTENFAYKYETNFSFKSKG